MHDCAIESNAAKFPATKIAKNSKWCFRFVNYNCRDSRNVFIKEKKLAPLRAFVSVNLKSDSFERIYEHIKRGDYLI